jgi:hypothetical protein
MNNVTVLTDEYGLQREYNEVQRRASVGERIRVVNATQTDGKYGNGDEFIVINANRWANGKAVTLDKIEQAVYHSEYVVLEPTDIVHVDGVSYRMGQRKANVGERVVITQRGSHDFSVGQVVTISKVTEHSMSQTRYANSFRGWLFDNEYAVLIPLDSAETPPLSTLPADDQRDAIIASLAARVTELEAQVKRHHHMLYEPSDEGEYPTLPSLTERTVDRFREMETEVAALKRPSSAELSEKITETLTKITRKVPKQMTRDAVIERAKVDVAELKVTHYPTLQKYYVAYNLSWRPECDADYIVNGDKRTVVCLLRKRRFDGKGVVQSKGIARCAPDDVFNVHIGRAIALRRALGLAVPAEYTNAPQPTEVRVGDIVAGGKSNGFYSPDKRFTLTRDNGNGSFSYAERPTDWVFRDQIGRIIDDSRDEVSE